MVSCAIVALFDQRLVLVAENQNLVFSNLPHLIGHVTMDDMVTLDVDFFLKSKEDAS